MKNEYDVVIAGGGLIGASLACALGNSSYRVAVLEQQALHSAQQPSYDDRGIALSLASCRVMQGIGLWGQLESRLVPIRRIHVSQLGSFGTVSFDAREMNLEAMGYVAIAREIGEVLLNKLSVLENIDYLCPVRVKNVHSEKDHMSLELDGSSQAGSNLRCSLLVAADGSMSQIRQQLGIGTHTKDYSQTAIVANVSVDKTHGDTAYERFTPRGPIALLPVKERDFVSVRCVSNSDLPHFTEMNDDEYVANLNELKSRQAGKIINLGARKMYPLKLIISNEQYSGRTLFLGNAAHTIHPNGAQGFNLGLRDVAGLAEILIRGNEVDPGRERLLQEYSILRRDDQNRVTAFTDSLPGIFYQQSILRRSAGAAAMVFLNSIPAFKEKFARYAMGIAGRQPAMVRGLGIMDL